MGNSSSLDKPKELKVFQTELSRKMTVHLLSNNEEDCIKFIKEYKFIFLFIDSSNNSLEEFEISSPVKIFINLIQSSSLFDNK